jgi:dTDP-4-amino-4,6-dideoxygalactose transaminase
MGLTNLEAIDSFVARNRDNYECYAEHFAGLPGFRLFAYDAAQTPNYQYVIFEVDESKTRLTRDELVAVLHEENVFARRYFFPGCHRMEPYRTLMPGVSLPETERICGQVIAFPTGTAIDAEKVKQIAAILSRAMENADAIRAALRLRTPPSLPIPVPLPDLRRRA